MDLPAGVSIIEIAMDHRWTYKRVLLDFHADVDECATEVDNCEHTCHNSNGSYTCSCRLGFRLHSDGQQCDGMSQNLKKIHCENVWPW